MMRLETSLDVSLQFRRGARTDSIRAWTVRLFVGGLVVWLCCLPVEASGWQGMGTGNGDFQASAPKPGFRFLQKTKNRIQYKLSVVGGSRFTAHGYRRIEATIYNAGPGPVTIRLEAKSEGLARRYSYGYDSPFPVGDTCKSQDVVVDEGATIRLKVYVPNASVDMMELGLVVNNEFLAFDARSMQLFTHANGSWRGPSPSSSILLEPGLFSDELVSQLEADSKVESVNAGSASFGFGSHRRSLELVDGKAVENWGESWIDYSCFDLIIGSEKFFDGLSPRAREAIRDYVVLGGILLIYNQEKLPTWLASDLSGTRSLDALFLDRKDGRGGHMVEIAYRDYGCGRVFLDSGKFSSWMTLLTFNSGFYDAASHRNAFSIFEASEFNIRIVFWGVLLFVVIIGPVNYLLCRYYWQNMMMIVVTTPLVSVLATVVFLIGDLFSQGITPTSKMQTFTILDQDRKQAFTMGTFGVYSPLGARAPQFDLDTEILKQNDLDAMRRESSRKVSILFDGDRQVLYSGWVRPRQEEYFGFRNAEHSDLRVTFRRLESGGIEVLNGLPVEIRRLRFRDLQGNCFRCSSLAAGESVVMEAFELAGEDDPQHDLVTRFRGMDPNRCFTVAEEMWNSGFLGRGHYLAETESSAFVSPPVEGTIEKPASSYIYGIVGEVTE